MLRLAQVRPLGGNDAIGSSSLGYRLGHKRVPRPAAGKIPIKSLILCSRYVTIDTVTGVDLPSPALQMHASSHG